MKGEQSVMSIEALDLLCKIPSLSTTQFPRGGAYDVNTNVWICHEFATILAEDCAEQNALFQGFALSALAAGALHRRQLEDNRAGHIWPLRWLQRPAGEELVTFCRQHPDAATPYSCLNDAYTIAPYSAFYRQALAKVVQGLDALLACSAPSAKAQTAYLTALKQAYTYDLARRSDVEPMGEADAAWVAIRPMYTICSCLSSPKITRKTPALF